MGRKRHIGQFRQRMACRQGLGHKNIKPRTAQMAGSECFHQRILIQHSAARGIDQQSALPHAGDLRA